MSVAEVTGNAMRALQFKEGDRVVVAHEQAGKVNPRLLGMVGRIYGLNTSRTKTFKIVGDSTVREDPGQTYWVEFPDLEGDVKLLRGSLLSLAD